MIRREPTRITISHLEIEEIVAKRQQALGLAPTAQETSQGATRSASAEEGATRNESASSMQDATSGTNAGAGAGAGAHPADLRAQEREQMTAAQRLGAR